jgi:hypothetical protein
MTSCLVATFLGLLSLAAHADPPGAVVLEVDRGTVNAARRLGSDVAFYTSRARPVRSLAEIADPGQQMGTGDLGLARPLVPALRAGGVKLEGGAMNLMRLVSSSHFSALFADYPRLRLFALRRRADAGERQIVEHGGGVPVLLRARGEPDLTAGAAPTLPTSTPTASAPPAPDAFVTSFGPLVSVKLSPTARARDFDPRLGAHEDSRQARAGRQFVVLTIDRDFGAGQGVVAFLFGMGTILEPEFEALQLRDGAGHRYPLTASHAEGRNLELAYEVPAAARDLQLVDGDRRQPLSPR